MTSSDKGQGEGGQKFQNGGDVIYERPQKQKIACKKSLHKLTTVSSMLFSSAGGGGGRGANTHQTHEMTVPNEIIGCVIGKGGSKIAEIRCTSKTIGTPC